MRPRDDLDFPFEEYQNRLQALRDQMQTRAIDVLIVTSPENIFYLTGFQTTGFASFQALVVPLSGEPFSVTRVLEDTGIQAMTWLELSRPYPDDADPIERLVDALKEFGYDHKRVGYERDSWFLTAPQRDQLFGLCPHTEFASTVKLVEELRLIKSGLELDKMRAASRAMEAGVQAGIDAVAPGVSDHDLAAEIHYAMYKAGSDYPSVSPFIAIGSHGAVGHATWKGQVASAGDTVFIEVGGAKARYHAAMMRTVAVGAPDPVTEQAAQTVLDAVDAALDAVRPGARVCDVDAVSRAIFSARCPNFGGRQLSRSGYGIGIAFPPDWGEGHMLSFHAGETRELEPNMVFHLIPWIIVPGKQAMGFSETVRVSEDGYELLSQFERKLFVNA